MISPIAIRVFLALTFVALSLSPVHARLSYAPTETPDGHRFVIISGEFAHDDDLNEFTGVVRQFKPSFVTFKSPGGNLTKAMELGRLIRINLLNTMQLRVLIAPPLVRWRSWAA